MFQFIYKQLAVLGNLVKPPVTKGWSNVPIKIIVHHTGGTDAIPMADTSFHTFEIVDEYHRKLWGFKSSLGHYIGYHYFIEKNGTVKQGRADSDEGAHTRGQNNQSIGICMAGNFDATMPTEEQKKSLRDLLLRLMVLYRIAPDQLFPHRHFAVKTCYGRLLYDSWLKDILQEK